MVIQTTKKALLLMIVVSGTTGATQELTERYERLTSEIRCVVCQNQSIAESSSIIAIEMKSRIQLSLAEGKSDQDIKTDLSLRYGDFILYDPPFKSKTWLLWLAPVVFFLLAIGLVSRRSISSTVSIDRKMTFYFPLNVRDFFKFTPKKGVAFRWCMMGLLIMFLGWGYSVWGGFAQIQSVYALQAFEDQLNEILDELPLLTQPEAFIKLKALSLTQNLTPLVLGRLGILYTTIEWWMGAADVFWRAYQETGDVEYGTGYLNAVFMAQNGALSAQDKKVLEAVLLKQTDNTTALNLKALDAFSHKNYEEAKNLWVQLRTQLEPDSSLYGTITKAIEKCS